MSINPRKFDFKAPSKSKNTEDKPAAQFWGNIGYMSNVIDEATGEPRFVPLGLGIPFDSIETLPTDGSNVLFAQFNQAKNQLRDDVLANCADMLPGEAVYHDIGDTGLQLQIRRVKEKTALPTDGSNPFLRK